MVNDNILEGNLPTLNKLKVVSIPPDLDAKKVATQWLKLFTAAIEARDIQGVSALFVQDAFWRDILALTWDFRTFSGLPLIKKFLTDRLGSANPRTFKLKDEFLGLQQPYPDLAWINFMFDFETDVGLASGIARLVPLANGEWKAHTIFTNLEDLKGFPEKVGSLRDHATNHGKWEEERRRESQFEDAEPVVVIIGGGQSGLALAARLKVLQIPTLVVEKNSRIGDNWRNRYDALCLHDLVWYDHMPYIPFPSTWPIYTPSKKFANWLESYAEALELNVWTSSTVVRASQSASNKWNVTIKQGNGRERVFSTKHLVFATGIGGCDVQVPTYPGMDEFRGKILHSTQYKRAADHNGKKVVVVGACTSAHDIAVDHYDHGVDVTMYQRSSTYVMSQKNGFRILMGGLYAENGPSTDTADRLTASFPNYMNMGMLQRGTKVIEELDKDLLNGLRRRGFRLNMGINGTGVLPLILSRAGGYYFDTGGSKLIADGKIKLKNDSQLERFTARGLKFKDGSELDADVVIFATGMGDTRSHIRRVCGDDVADRCKPIWKLNKEGELNGVWRDLGFQGLWYMVGNLAFCRFHSKHVALQIKAMEEGVFGSRYSADD